MADDPDRVGLGAAVRGAVPAALRPPVHERRFWLIQVTVVALAGAHLLADLEPWGRGGAFPAGVPVALLIVPTGYAALRYGLAGSAATGLWAVLLWLPDLLLPHDQGHAGSDLVDLALVAAVAVFVGHRIQAERSAHSLVEKATAQRLALEARYHQLFDTTHVPILLVDRDGVVRDANRAAGGVFGAGLVGRDSSSLLGGEPAPAPPARRVVRLAGGREFRLAASPLPMGTDRAATQVVLEDVTEERRRRDSTARYAALVVRAEEDQRRRLARELHDEPLQLFLHLARTLEHLAGTAGVPAPVADGLRRAHDQALDAAGRLRTVVRDLRPPALDRLGLMAALSGLLAEAEDRQPGLTTELEVTGSPGRLPADVELAAFRVAQEAVHNAVKHAGASRLVMRVGSNGEELVVEVTDDGRGFEPPAGDGPVDHFGLLGMAERAHLLGGQVDISSAPGAGTSVQAAFGLHGQPPAGGRRRGALAPGF